MIRFVGSQMPLYSCRVRIKFNRFIIQFKVFIDKLCVTFSKTNLVIRNNNVARGFFSSLRSHKYGFSYCVTMYGWGTNKRSFFEHFLLYLQGPCVLPSLFSQLCWEISRDTVWSSHHADQVSFILYVPAKVQEGFMVARNGSTLGAGALWNSGKGSSCSVRNFGAEEVPVWWKALPCWRCSVRFCLWSNLGVSTKSFCRAHGQSESSESSETRSANEGAVFSRLGWYHFKET